jgi:hypothetical protein
LGDDAQVKRAKTRSQISVSDRRSSLTRPASDAIVKFRDRTGRAHLDLDARLLVSDNGKAYLQSTNFVKDLLSRDLSDHILFIFTEQVDDVLRMTIFGNDKTYLDLLCEDRPEIRLQSFDLPPVSVTEIEPSYSKDGMPPNGIYESLLSAAQKDDPALFSVHTDSFLAAPHIVVPLLSHLAGLSAEDNLKFPIQIKRLADQFRTILETDGCPLRIKKVERNHLETWADAQGKKFAYLDGGIAKIAGLPGTEPTAMRVGIYSVIPGEEKLDEREGGRSSRSSSGILLIEIRASTWTMMIKPICGD